MPIDSPLVDVLLAEDFATLPAVMPSPHEREVLLALDVEAMARIAVKYKQVTFVTRQILIRC